MNWTQVADDPLKSPRICLNLWIKHNFNLLPYKLRLNMQPHVFPDEGNAVVHTKIRPVNHSIGGKTGNVGLGDGVNATFVKGHV
jgi:hypothetical protein